MLLFGEVIHMWIADLCSCRTMRVRLVKSRVHGNTPCGDQGIFQTTGVGNDTYIY